MRAAALVVDSLRELRARRLFWFYALFAALLVFVAFSLVHTRASIHMTVNGRVMTADDSRTIANLVLIAFARFLANVVLVLVLFGMGTVMSGILDRGTAEVYLSKPVPRSTVLLARVAGHWAAVALALLATEAALIFVAGTRGVWHPSVLLSAVPILLVALVYLSLLALFNVLGVGSGLSGITALVVLLASTALRYREAFATLYPHAAWRAALDWAYRILPKSGEVLAAVPRVIEDGRLSLPVFATWTTAAFTVGTLALAIIVFERRDY